MIFYIKDVLECFGQRPNQIHWAIHSKNSSFGTGAWYDLPTSTQDSYHNYGALWTKTEVSFYFDDWWIASAPTPPDMHDPMYMIANLAVGG